jgi:hypothetical protein
VGRDLDAAREGYVLRLDRRLRCTALAHMARHITIRNFPPKFRHA